MAPPKAVVLAPVRIEPRAFMANERTLLQWTHISALLSAIATAVFAHADTTPMRSVGLLLGLPAVLFVFYAASMYFRRLRGLRLRTLDSFDDRTGPLLMLLTMVSAVLVNLGLGLWRHFSVGGMPSDTYVHNMGSDTG